MKRDHVRKLNRVLVVSGVLVCLMSLGGTWGTALGQTAGPAILPVSTEVGGAEGAPAEATPIPTRQRAVAGESGEAPALALPTTPVPNMPGRRRAVAGESGEATDTSMMLPNVLGLSGAGTSVHWLLLITSLLLVGSGGIIVLRLRRTK